MVIVVVVVVVVILLRVSKHYQHEQYGVDAGNDSMWCLLASTVFSVSFLIANLFYCPQLLYYVSYGAQTTHLVWTYNNQVLEVVKQFIYLGTTFTSGGTFKVNYQTLSGKGLKAMNALMSMVKLYNLNPDIMCQLFDACVSSTMCYGAEIWGF
jgi:hypothetical protein